MRISGTQAAQKLLDYPSGKIFTVTFIKRTSGEVRVINCRKGVTIGVTGKGLAFSPTSKDLLVVWDLCKKAFRMIDLRNLISFKMDGKTYKVL